jgi:hypothetical protein
VYIRCDDWLEWAGWGDGNSEIDDGDGGPQEPEEDFDWKQHRNDVYKPTYDEARRISRIPFAAQPVIMIVIVTFFYRFGDGVGNDHLDHPRILYNFIEASLKSYHALKRTCATVTVALAHTERLEKETASTASVVESPIT